MTRLMFRYLMLITIAFYISPFFVFEKIYQTVHMTVFEHLSKHLEGLQKYTSYFKLTLFMVFECGFMLHAKPPWVGYVCFSPY